MKQYKVPAILNGEKVKFVVSVPSDVTKYQVQLILTGKYKDENLTIISDEIVQIVELDFTQGD